MMKVKEHFITGFFPNLFTFMLIKRFYLCLMFFLLKLSILMDTYEKCANKWLRNLSVILITVFVATPGGGCSSFKKLF